MRTRSSIFENQRPQGDDLLIAALNGAPVHLKRENGDISCGEPHARFTTEDPEMCTCDDCSGFHRLSELREPGSMTVTGDRRIR